MANSLTEFKINFQQYRWGNEILSILNEIENKLVDMEKYEQEDFETKYKNEKKNIFDEIKEYRKKSNIEFIEFILREHPPKRSPLRKNKTASELWKEDAKSFAMVLSGRYSPDNYPKNTEEEKLNYTIFHEICKEINSILSDMTLNLNLK